MPCSGATSRRALRQRKFSNRRRQNWRFNWERTPSVGVVIGSSSSPSRTPTTLSTCSAAFGRQGYRGSRPEPITFSLLVLGFAWRILSRGLQSCRNVRSWPVVAFHQCNLLVPRTAACRRKQTLVNCILLMRRQFYEDRFRLTAALQKSARPPS